jgi:tripartite-type tricarboxylate transporter receptor subunit TctC
VVDAGKVRRIAITSKTRFRGLPDLPAVSETLPDIAVDGFFAIVAPAGTPADVVARLNREIAKYLQAPEIQQRLISFGLATEGAGTPASTAQFIHEEQDRWRALAQELDVEPQ